MEVRAIRPSELEAARRLVVAAGWDRRVRDAAQFRELVSRYEKLGFVRSEVAMELAGERGVQPKP